MKIKLNDFRNISMDEYYELKSFNVVVGKNSSGKSSFLRFFPLIKQSLEKDISSPLLWYGSYVDFGSFEETINNQNTLGEIKISFSIDLNEIKWADTNWLFYSESLFLNEHYNDRRTNMEGSIEITIVISKDMVKRIDLISKSFNIEIIDDGFIQVKLNGNRVFDEYDMVTLKKQNSHNILMDSFFCFKRIKGDSDAKPLNFSRMATENLHSSIGKMMHHQTSEEKRRYINDIVENTYFELLSNSDFNFSKSKTILNSKNTLTNTVYNKMMNYSDYKEINDEVIKWLVISKLEWLLQSINTYFKVEFENLHYIAPLRATAERYYRHQGLSVKTIDSKGENLSGFIKSLEKIELESLNELLLKSFNFEIRTENIKGHNSISIKEKQNGKVTNITDSGFGYSQLLPIIIQLWSISFQASVERKGKISKRKYIIIEQPELHLHPALQAKLIDVFCDVIEQCKNQGILLTILLETHSETMVNRAYKNVILNRINFDGINISIFDKNENGYLEIKNAVIDENYKLTNWPVSFFEPEE